jgi:hypothetical protein
LIDEHETRWPLNAGKSATLDGGRASIDLAMPAASPLTNNYIRIDY